MSGKHRFSVIDGGGQRSLGDTFSRPASALPLGVISRQPSATSLKHYTSNVIMREVIDNFQEAHENGFSFLGILQDHDKGEFQYLPSNEGHEFFPWITSNHSSNIVDLKPTGLELKFIFDLKKPFEQQFSLDHIRSVTSLNDIITAFARMDENNSFSDPYGSLPDISSGQISGLLPNLKPTINLSLRQKSAPFLRQIIAEFDRAWEESKKTFIVIAEPFSEMLLIVTLDRNQNAQNFINKYRQENPTHSLLMAFDVEQAFEEQFPMHLYERIDKWDALYMQPAINPRVLPNKIINGRIHPHQPPVF